MESSTHAIVESLTRAIVEHRLQPGTKLAEQKLADHFGVSRTLVRQALFQLAAGFYRQVHAFMRDQAGYRKEIIALTLPKRKLIHRNRRVNHSRVPLIDALYFRRHVLAVRRYRVNSFSLADIPAS